MKVDGADTIALWIQLLYFFYFLELRSLFAVLIVFVWLNQNASCSDKSRQLTIKLRVYHVTFSYINGFAQQPLSFQITIETPSQPFFDSANPFITSCFLFDHQSHSSFNKAHHIPRPTPPFPYTYFTVPKNLSNQPIQEQHSTMSSAGTPLSESPPPTLPVPETSTPTEETITTPEPAPVGPRLTPTEVVASRKKKDTSKGTAGRNQQRKLKNEHAFLVHKGDGSTWQS